MLISRGSSRDPSGAVCWPPRSGPHPGLTPEGCHQRARPAGCCWSGAQWRSSCCTTVSQSCDLVTLFMGFLSSFFPRCCDCDRLTGVCSCWGGSFLPGVTVFIWACLKYPVPMDLKEKHLVGPAPLLLCVCHGGYLYWAPLPWVFWEISSSRFYTECEQRGCREACGGYNYDPSSEVTIARVR